MLIFSSTGLLMVYCELILLWVRMGPLDSNIHIGFSLFLVAVISCIISAYFLS